MFCRDDQPSVAKQTVTLSQGFRVTAPPKVHGLDGSFVEPDWPNLTLQEVDQLLRKYPAAQKANALLTVSPRPFSAASVVSTPHGKVFVKRHHASVRSEADLLEEHRLLQYLHHRDPIVVAPLADAAGETATSTAEWTYEVHPFAPGIDLYEEAHSWTPFLSVAQARNAGRALARLHAAVAGHTAPARRTRTLVTSFTIFAQENPWAQLDRYLNERPQLLAYLENYPWREQIQQTFAEHHSALRPYLSSLEPLWTHNDFHASNLFWSDDSPQAEVSAIIDFGLADRTNAIHDIATAIERNAIRWLEIETGAHVVHFDHIDAFLGGYESLRPMSRQEAEAIGTLLPLVHAEFALSETDYFIRVLKSPQKAEVAYKIFLLGHANWFLTDAGKRLREHLSRWASGQRHASGPENQSASLPAAFQQDVQR
jgi:Ser/Thr protein kinase RdoA (MazF antagonist)